jgi:ketosteroid isomerase-like protein
MSRANVALVRAVVDAWNRGDIDDAISHCDPDFEIDFTRSIGPERGTYRGHDGFRKLVGSYLDVFDEITFEADHFIDAGDDVVMPHVGTVRHRDGITASVTSVFVWTVKDGRLTRFCMFNSRDEALAAVGLQPE